MVLLLFFHISGVFIAYFREEEPRWVYLVLDLFVDVVELVVGVLGFNLLVLDFFV